MAYTMDLRKKIIIIIGFCIILSVSTIVIITKLFDKIEDEFFKDEDVVFAVLFDKNGYVPTHNSQYSLPPSKDPQKNLLYSRSKRNFGDRKEIKKILQYQGKE